MHISNSMREDTPPAERENTHFEATMSDKRISQGWTFNYVDFVIGYIS